MEGKASARSLALGMLLSRVPIAAVDVDGTAASAAAAVVNVWAAVAADAVAAEPCCPPAIPPAEQQTHRGWGVRPRPASPATRGKPEARNAARIVVFATKPMFRMLA